MKKYEELIQYLKYSLTFKLEELESYYGNSPDDSIVSDAEAHERIIGKYKKAIKKVNKLNKLLLEI